jgi:hypothetical protein
MDELSEAEKEIFSLIESGSVRRNQLDQVATALQAVRLLKKFRFGGDPVAKANAAYTGFKERNEQVLHQDRSGYLRRRLIDKMRRLLARALPCPVDNRFSRCSVKVVNDAFTAYFGSWAPSTEMDWSPRFGQGAVREFTPFLLRWEMVDGSSPILEAIRSGELGRIMREVPTSGLSRAQAVEKDFKRFRLITVEDLAITFLQHGVRRVMYSSIHAGPLAWSAMDVMHLENAQVINQRYALTGSKDSTVATIDESDASDWLDVRDVEEVMPGWLVPLLTACRSTHCDVDGDVVELGMYAGMGNASTFVVESLMFWAAARAMMALHGRNLSVCSVYGDDVVIDSDAVPYVLEAFEVLGWKVNRGKSFWGSNPFRESCGMWAFNGHCITPARFDGYDLTTSGGLAGFRESIANLLNQGRGLGIIVADKLLKQVGHKIPVSDFSIPGSCVVHDKYHLWCNNYIRARTRINRDTQLWEAKTTQVEPRTVMVPADRIGYLYGSLSGSLHTDVIRSRGQVIGHGIRIPVPYRTVAKERWLACEPSWGSRSRI